MEDIAGAEVLEVVSAAVVLVETGEGLEDLVEDLAVAGVRVAAGDSI